MSSVIVYKNVDSAKANILKLSIRFFPVFSRISPENGLIRMTDNRKMVVTSPACETVPPGKSRTYMGIRVRSA
jgi:hypothetical protein